MSAENTNSQSAATVERQRDGRFNLYVYPQPNEDAEKVRPFRGQFNSVSEIDTYMREKFPGVTLKI